MEKDTDSSFWTMQGLGPGWVMLLERPRVGRGQTTSVTVGPPAWPWTSLPTVGSLLGSTRQAFHLPQSLLYLTAYSCPRAPNKHVA